jgi:hypothetical protein
VWIMQPSIIVCSKGEAISGKVSVHDMGKDSVQTIHAQRKFIGKWWIINSSPRGDGFSTLPNPPVTGVVGHAIDSDKPKSETKTLVNPEGERTWESGTHEHSRWTFAPQDTHSFCNLEANC